MLTSAGGVVAGLVSASVPGIMRSVGGLVSWLIGVSLLKLAGLTRSLPGVRGSVCWLGDRGSVILLTLHNGVAARLSTEPPIAHRAKRLVAGAGTASSKSTGREITEGPSSRSGYDCLVEESRGEAGGSPRLAVFV